MNQKENGESLWEVLVALALFSLTVAFAYQAYERNVDVFQNISQKFKLALQGGHATG